MSSVSIQTQNANVLFGVWFSITAVQIHLLNFHKFTELKVKTKLRGSILLKRFQFTPLWYQHHDGWFYLGIYIHWHMATVCDTSCSYLPSEWYLGQEGGKLGPGTDEADRVTRRVPLGSTCQVANRGGFRWCKCMHCHHFRLSIIRHLNNIYVYFQIVIHVTKAGFGILLTDCSS